MEQLILFCVLAALQAADAWTTMRLLAGGGRELNPRLAAAFVRFGPLPVLIAGKAVLLLVMWLAGSAEVLIFFVGWYAAICWRNWLELRMQRERREGGGDA